MQQPRSKDIRCCGECGSPSAHPAEIQAVHSRGSELTEATWQSLVASPLRESLRLLDLSECGTWTAECVQDNSHLSVPSCESLS